MSPAFCRSSFVVKWHFWRHNPFSSELRRALWLDRVGTMALALGCMSASLCRWVPSSIVLWLSSWNCSLDGF